MVQYEAFKSSSFKSKLKSGIAMSNFDFDFELRLNMGEKTQENSLMGYSAAYPTGRERCRF